MDENIIMVINMEVDGPAEKAGLKVGDQILSINNIKADEEDNCEVVKLFSEIYGNSTHNEVTVKRGNEILKFKL
jgi:C-terminal processing protease CtpA/Prc